MNATEKIEGRYQAYSTDGYRTRIVTVDTFAGTDTTVPDIIVNGIRHRADEFAADADEHGPRLVHQAGWYLRRVDG